MAVADEPEHAVPGYLYPDAIADVQVGLGHDVWRKGDLTPLADPSGVRVPVTVFHRSGGHIASVAVVRPIPLGSQRGQVQRGRETRTRPDQILERIRSGAVTGGQVSTHVIMIAGPRGRVGGAW